MERIHPGSTRPVGAAARELHDSPEPFPYGWFAVAFSEELHPGNLRTRPFMDREIVMFRNRSGKLTVVDAYCPHLGAHLGRGGRVVGDQLRCPFHGFLFDAAGTCTSTPYGPPPPAARLAVYESIEVAGVILVYHGEPGSRAGWTPMLPSDDGGWRKGRCHTMRSFHGHPQEVTENSVDLGHLAALHGFESVQVIEPLTVDGPRLRTRYAIVRPFAAIGGIKAEFTVRVEGLGFSLVELTILGGWRVRQLVLSTPVSERAVTVRLRTSIQRRSGATLTRPLLASVESLLERLVLRNIINEVGRDQKIWEHKRYLGRPALAAGDGPIGKYRAWARQFDPPAGTHVTTSRQAGCRTRP